jgi:hypothetical protein
MKLGYGVATAQTGLDSGQEQKLFRFSKICISLVGPTQPTIQRVKGALYPGERLPWCEADQLLPSEADVKNAWS